MFDWALFNQVFYASTEDLIRNILPQMLEEKGYVLLTDEDNYLVGVPPTDNPDAATSISLVAHCDTIIREGVDLRINGTTITNAKGVLGADDRAGVYAILHLLNNTGKRPLLIFTNYEERGGLGVKELVKEEILKNEDVDHTADINLFIEIDRRGHEDYVYYLRDLPESVHAFARRYNLVKAHGSYSDVRDLSEAYNIPHLNISAGYYNQHGKTELLKLDELMATIVRVGLMLHDDDVPADRLEEKHFFRSYSYEKWKPEDPSQWEETITASGHTTWKWVGNKGQYKGGNQVGFHSRNSWTRCDECFRFSDDIACPYCYPFESVETKKTLGPTEPSQDSASEKGAGATTAADFVESQADCVDNPPWEYCRWCMELLDSSSLSELCPDCVDYVRKQSKNSPAYAGLEEVDLSDPFITLTDDEWANLPVEMKEHYVGAYMSKRGYVTQDAD